MFDKFGNFNSVEELNKTAEGLKNEGDTERDVYKSASAAMDVILGRGGDQAVIRQNGKYLFFGGKVEEVEKRTKVKARTVAHALENLIKEYQEKVTSLNIPKDTIYLINNKGEHTLYNNELAINILKNLKTIIIF